MKLGTAQSRIAKYLWTRKSDLFSKEFFKTARRVLYRHFNVWDKVGEQEFKNNLAVIEKRPWNIHVELTNLCNANCIFCAYQYQTRPHSVMSSKVFNKVLDDYCAIGGGNFHFGCVVGDPLLDRNIMKRIRAARFKKQIKYIATITNAIGFRSDEIKEFLTSGINKITISTGPWSKQEYEKIFRTRSYNKMKQNVTALLKTNQRLGNKVHIVLSFRSNLTMKQTLSLPDYQEVSQLQHEIEFNTDYDSWTGKITQKDLLEGMAMRPKIKLEGEPCQWFYHGPVVFPTGDVGICGCRDYNADGELILGNIMDTSLLELWGSEKMDKLRAGFYHGQFPEICSKCGNYVNLDLYRKKQGSQRVKLVSKMIDKVPVN